MGTESSLRLKTKNGVRLNGLPRKKERLTVKTRGDDEASNLQIPHRSDPAELRIYIKQLSRALKFLPLGSRAYYAVTGELLRASTQLKAFIPTGSAVKGEH